MQHATLCLIIDEKYKKILLGMKKRGFGEGKWNGFGGKPKKGEKFHDAAAREIKEETGLKISKKDINKIGKLNFTFSAKPEWNQIVHLFLAKTWQGSPKESEEMKPRWFDFKEIPFDKMWEDDKHWMPLILKGKKIQGDFIFEKDNESIKKHSIEEKQYFS